MRVVHDLLGEHLQSGVLDSQFQEGHTRSYSYVVVEVGVPRTGVIAMLVCGGHVYDRQPCVLLEALPMCLSVLCL